MRRFSLIRLTGVGVMLGAALLTAFLLRFGPASPAQERPPARPAEDYATLVRPLLQKYCLGCHSTKAKKGSLDLERFATLDDLRRDLKPWQALLEQVEAGEMPPANRPQPTAEEKARLLARVRGFLDAEARARAGDPGHVPLRRLSNAEYDYTIRDLTGVDLRPTREFPADGAAGEGFSNAAEALGDISPALLTKYVQAARQVAEHAVLLPDGFRFSPSKTRRDWTDEGTAQLRAFYARHVGGDGRLPIEPYLSAAVRHREALLSGKVTTKDVAARERLNPNYLGVLWQALTDRKPAYPLDVIQGRWRTAKETDVPLLVKEVTELQAALWRTVKVGNYVQASWNGADGYRESLTRQVPVDPPAATSVPLRLAVKPVPGEPDVTLLLGTDEVEGKEARVVWHRPRFEAAGKPPLLLRDYADYGPAFAVDPTSLFVGAARYLAAVVESGSETKGGLDQVASRHQLDRTLLSRWVELAALPSKRADAETPTAPATPLHLLDDRVQRDGGKAAINGWRKRGSDLPVLVTNASDTTEQIPGRVSPHGVAMHPTPGEFVAVAWTSPVAATVRVTARGPRPSGVRQRGGMVARTPPRRPGRRPRRGEGRSRQGSEPGPTYGEGRSGRPAGAGGGGAGRQPRLRPDRGRVDHHRGGPARPHLGPGRRRGRQRPRRQPARRPAGERRRVAVRSWRGEGRQGRHRPAPSARFRPRPLAGGGGRPETAGGGGQAGRGGGGAALQPAAGEGRAGSAPPRSAGGDQRPPVRRRGRRPPREAALEGCPSPEA